MVLSEIKSSVFVENKGIGGSGTMLASKNGAAWQQVYTTKSMPNSKRE